MILSATLRGVDARVVATSTTRAKGLPGIHITGLSAAAERESRVRVAAALSNADHDVNESIHVELNAAGAAIDGTALDLAIALAVAVAHPSTTRVAAFAELSLLGELQPVRGVLSAVEALRGHADVVLVAPENGPEAALIDGIRVLAVRTLADALRFLAGDERGVSVATRTNMNSASAGPDMSDVVGNARARRALEIAAAGGHHLLLVGPPGAGKTMLARRLPGIMPPLTEGEALEVTRVHSAAGLNIGGGLIGSRPFRAPHHSTTPPGIVGGGAAMPRPGEISLAHQGVLFLDELPEFARHALEVLHEPLVTGEVVLARASGTVRFPSRPLLIASTSPCPCGHFGAKRCTCTAESRKRYLGRIPERLLAAFDLRVQVESVDIARQRDEQDSQNSATIARRVAAARNAMGNVAIDLTRVKVAALAQAGVTTREGHARAIRVARTIAALEGCTTISEQHVTEAASLVQTPA